MRALVIGGSGPTGPYIVEGLRQRGYAVAVLNRGVHPVALPDGVERIVGDPHFLPPLRQVLAKRTFDVVVASYGRLTFTAEALAGRTAHFIGIGGNASYRGYMESAAPMFPSGMIIPTPESAPIVEDPAEQRFAALVVAAEKAVFHFHSTGTIFRYPYVYGPRQVIPREWSVVRRILDGRRVMMITHGGLGLMTHMYAENIAHAVMQAVDKPKVAAGKIYNCGDEVQLDLRQLIEVIADALKVKMEIVSVPDLPNIRRAMFFPIPNHKLMDTFLIRHELGYRDVVPTLEAVARTARWYAQNPIERGSEFEQRLPDPFDYAAEDKFIALYRDFESKAAEVNVTAREPGHPYAHPKASSLSRDHRGR
jgi:nucleoside-diphosphate-sugar epimerase